jgi:hypothetical protein
MFYKFHPLDKDLVMGHVLYISSARQRLGHGSLEMSFVSPYNHLLFLAKTNKEKLENDNNIDFLLSIGQNVKKYSSILD